MERKQESVVEVSLSAQRAVVDVGLLLVVFVSVEPAESFPVKHMMLMLLIIYFLYFIVSSFFSFFILSFDVWLLIDG